MENTFELFTFETGIKRTMHWKRDDGIERDTNESEEKGYKVYFIVCRDCCLINKKKTTLWAPKGPNQAEQCCFHKLIYEFEI